MSEPKLENARWKPINWLCQRCGSAAVSAFTTSPDGVNHRDLVRCDHCKLTAGVIIWEGTTYLEWAEDDGADFSDPFAHKE